ASNAHTYRLFFVKELLHFRFGALCRQQQRSEIMQDYRPLVNTQIKEKPQPLTRPGFSWVRRGAYSAMSVPTLMAA
ncbi:hypothetical protein, partial [Massilia sp. TS11]|uniref:hypothetical protein n=1 Tax=Massilia sp. TS11 TaxID=2908003 RepID=UPI001EDBF72F